MNEKFTSITVIAIIVLSNAFRPINTLSAEVLIVRSDKASLQELAAARELRRYIYLRTGELASIQSNVDKGDAIVIRIDNTLEEQEYKLAAAGAGGRLDISGGSPIGALYGAYRFIEHLGVRFYLHGDVIPDEIITEVCQTFSRAGLPVNRKKLRMMRAGSRQVVTGLVLDRACGIEPEERARVRVAVHELEVRLAADGTVDPHGVRSVEGRVRRLTRYHPGKGKSLLRRVTALPKQLTA